MTRRILAAAASGIVALSTPVPAQAEPEPPVYGRVVTVAGTGEQGYSGDGWPATQARLGDLLSIAVGPDGSVHITDHLNKRLRRVDPEGVIDTVPGTRGLRSPETDGPEHDGWIYSPSNGPTASAVAADGTLYLATDQEIRRYGRDGKHTVIGGNGELGFTDGNGGDGGPATEAWIYEPRDIAVTDDGSVYVADYHNGRIRRIDPHGVISTVAGGGNSSAAEGKPATRADLDAPAGVAVAADGTVYFVQEGDGTVYRVGPDGLLSHAVDLAGRGRVGGIDVADDGTLYLTDLSRGLVLEAGADGTTAPVGPRLGGRLQDLAVGPNGDLYVAGIAQVLRLVRDGETAPADPPEPATSRWADDEPGTVHPVAGTGTLLEVPVPPGQEPPPGASGVAVGPDGSVYVAEPAGHRVRRIGQDGKAEPFAGTGVKGGDGDGKPAERATLSGPSDVAADAEGNVYIADAGNNRIRRVDADGIISTVTTVEAPRGVAVDRTGAVYVTTGETVARLDARERAVPVAGGGDRWADEADDAPARQADLTGPNAVAVGPDGTVYLTEDGRPAVRAVRPDNVLVTVAGSAYRDRDEGGFAGDGGPATRAELNHPDGVAVGPDGARYVADTYNNRIRRIAPNGTIATVAGTGERADRGDGGPATEAALTEPTDLAFGADGALYVTGTATGRVRRIAPDGTISTLADLAPPDRAERATDTQLSQVRSLAVGVDGTVYVAETSGKVYAVAGDGTLQPVGSDLPARPSVSGHLAAGADGSLYLGIDEIARRTPDGTATIVAGNLAIAAEPGPDVPATSARLRVTDLATGPDGTLHLADGETVYALHDGGLDPVFADAGPLGGIAIGPDGAVYAVVGHRVFRSVDGGEPEPVAGNGESISQASEEETEDGGPALEASLSYPTDVAVTDDGSLFVSTNDGIRRVDPDGEIQTVVHPFRVGDETHPATALAVGPAGDLYFAEPTRGQVRVVVRPAELDGPFRFPWTAFWIAAAALALGAGIVLVIRRRA